ncbi:PorV/PorQ family protein [Geochorda subterranea]|uniref:PorV/PorQ family protein n=1 Tax=Geochorda subterranea TaxID=3109564 RepID=A0ABZ1BMC4_9FIRM|nr:hypothetical protein [Limnochorda sp. LNt]WRP13829.1 hypothetical protein VLY81_10330 [Limnochorda sp. LNt]
MTGMRSKWALALAMVAVLAVGPAVAAADGDGTVVGAGAIFQIGAGARPLALGGAFAGVSEDENALFYNPAGLATLGRPGLTSFYSTQYQVVGYGALGLALRKLGVGALYLNSPGIPGAGEGGEILPNFAYSNLAGLVGAATELGPVAVGVRGKYLLVRSAELVGGDEPDLGPAQGTGAALDAGALVQLGPVRLGLVVENAVATPIRYSTGAVEAWERRLVAGASVRLRSLLLAADVESVGGHSQYYHAGAELGLGLLALRGGITAPMGGDGEDAADSRELTAGIGLRLGSLQVDYAYLMPATLPDSHRLSLALRF